VDKYNRPLFWHSSATAKSKSLEMENFVSKGATEDRGLVFASTQNLLPLDFMEVISLGFLITPSENKKP